MLLQFPLLGIIFVVTWLHLDEVLGGLQAKCRVICQAEGKSTIFPRSCLKLLVKADMRWHNGIWTSKVTLLKSNMHARPGMPENGGDADA